jgi:hypothetical protein
LHASCIHAYMHTCKDVLYFLVFSTFSHSCLNWPPFSWSRSATASLPLSSPFLPWPGHISFLLKPNVSYIYHHQSDPTPRAQGS